MTWLSCERSLKIAVNAQNPYQRRKFRPVPDSRRLERRTSAFSLVLNARTTLRHLGFVVKRCQGNLDDQGDRDGHDHADDAKQNTPGEKAKDNQNWMHARGRAKHQGSE